MERGEITWYSPGEFVFRGATYHVPGPGGLGPGWQGDGGKLLIIKPRPLIETYLELAPLCRGGRMVELGIMYGGSTAFLADLMEPVRFMALDLHERPLHGVRAHLERRGNAHRVELRFGVDQADAEALGAHVDQAFGESPLDLVIDDASHELAPTRASFEVLFPRLRPGGFYVIEDWAWHYVFLSKALDAMASGPRFATPEGVDELLRSAWPAAMEHLPLVGRVARAPWAPAGLRAWYEANAATLESRSSAPPEPLARLLWEQILTGAMSQGVIDRVDIRPHAAIVRRGPAALDPETFRLSDHFRDPYLCTSS